MYINKYKLAAVMISIPISLIAILSVYKLYRRSEYKNERNLALERFKSSIYRNDMYGVSIPYRIFKPDGYDKTKKYPLVLYLHGGAALGDDNIKQLEAGPTWWSSKKMQSRYPCFILAPQCPKGHKWTNKPGFAAPFKNYDQDKYPESDIMKSLVDLVEDTCKKYKIDKNRVYATGYSMGATGVWEMITRHPTYFAAAVVVSGENDPSKSTSIRNMPIWVFHGARDDVAPVENSQEMVRAIRNEGGKKIKFTEYFFYGHTIAGTVYRNENIASWLFKQKKEMP